MFSEEPKLNHSDATEEKTPSGESEGSPQQTATAPAPSREPVSVADPTQDDDDSRPAGDVDFGQLLDQFEQEQATLQEGEVVRGTVVGISERGVVIDFGYKSEGIVNPAEFTEDGVITVKAGDEVECCKEHGDRRWLARLIACRCGAHEGLGRFGEGLPGGLDRERSGNGAHQGWTSHRY